MTRLPIVLFFVALSFLCWGTYGPVLHLGQNAMNHSMWRPFICVGMAYFLVAVVVPFGLLKQNKESGKWTLSGIIWSLIAGSVGAVGALGIVVAFKSGGRPVYVMPLVFGCAPVVNTFVTMGMNRTHRQASLLFYIAVLLTALGAAGVFIFKPRPADDAPVASASEVSDVEGEAGDGDSEKGGTSSHDGAVNGKGDQAADRGSSGRGVLDWFTTVFAIIITALCWGSYGALLHKGQARMKGSRLRPFICVGLAYFGIAVIIPVLILAQWGESGRWGLIGSMWSLGAGSLGAIGALGIIMAFNYGGKPIFVMPLVFGGAPIVNTLMSMAQSYLRTQSVGEFSILFPASLVMVITGAVCVLLFAPRGKVNSHAEEAAPPPDDKPPPPADKPEPTPPAATREEPATTPEEPATTPEEPITTPEDPAATPEDEPDESREA